MIIILIVGIIFLVVGILLLISAKGKKERCTHITNGKVVDIIRDVTRVHSTTNNMNYQNGMNVRVGGINIGIGNNEYGNPGEKISFYPVIEYQVEDIKYVKRSNTGSSSPTYGVGQEVEVHYNGKDPNDFYIGKGNSSMGIGFIMTLFGVLFTCIFIIMQFVIK